MQQCKATVKGKERCPDERKPGSAFCEEHQTRPKAIQERENKSLNSVIDATEVFTPSFVGDNEPIAQEVEAARTERLPAKQGNIYEKTAQVLDQTIEWQDRAWETVKKLSPDEMRFLDKAGAEQLHSAVTVYERAMDRTIRAVTAIAKLNIDAQSVNVNKMIQEVVKGVVTKSLTRAGFDSQQIEQIRLYMAEEFERVAQEAG